MITGLMIKIKKLIIICSAAALVAIALGLSLGLTLPIKSISVADGAVFVQFQNETVCITGSRLRVENRAGSIKYVSISEDMLSCVDTSRIGENEVTVTYNSHSTKVKLHVISADMATCSLQEDSLPKTYEPNAELPTSGIINIWYNDIMFRSVAVVSDMLEPQFDSTLAGNYSAIITVRPGLATFYDYEILRIVSRIETVGRLYAEQNVPLEKSTLTGSAGLHIYYTDGTDESISIFDDGVFFGAAEVSMQGDTLIPVTFRGGTADCLLTVYPEGQRDAIDSIIVSNSAQGVYLVDEPIDFSGYYINVSYKYKSGTAQVSVTQDMVNATSFSEPNLNQAVTISYGELSASINVKIITEEESEQLTSITSDWYSLGQTVSYGEPLNYDGAVITAIYGYGYRTEQVNLTPQMVSGYSTEEYGIQTITISYEGVSLEKQINVMSPELEDVVTGIIGIANWVDSTFYSHNAVVIETGAYIYVEYGYGVRVEEVPLTLDMISGFVPQTLGQQTLTVTYEGCSTTLNIYVNDDSEAEQITGMSIKDWGKIYYIGEELDFDVCIITLIYANGARTEDVTLSSLASAGAYVGSYDKNLASTQYVYVYYEVQNGDKTKVLSSGAYCNWYYPPGSKIISAVSVQTDGAKTAYAVGESIDLANVILHITYGSGDSSEDIAVTESMISGFDSSAVAVGTITVEYLGWVATYAYTVI